MEPRMAPNTVSAPRDSEGFAVTAGIDKLQVFVNRSTRANWLKDRELTGTHEFRTLSDRLAQAKAEEPGLSEPLNTIKERMAKLKAQLRQERTQGWKRWVKNAEENSIGPSTDSCARQDQTTVRPNFLWIQFTHPSMRGSVSLKMSGRIGGSLRMASSTRRYHQLLLPLPGTKYAG